MASNDQTDRSVGPREGALGDVMTPPDEGRGRGRARSASLRAHALGFAAYLALSAAMFAPVLRHPATAYVGAIPDAVQSMWFLSLTAHSLAHHQSLIFTDLLNAPQGVNLMWNTSMLLLGLLAAPVTVTLGPVVAYNALVVAAFAVSASAAAMAIGRFCGGRLAAWVGGLLAAMSPYMVAQSLGHLDLVVMVYPPLAVLLVVELAGGGRRPWWVAGGALGLLTAAQALVMEEVVVVVALGCVLTLAVAWRGRSWIGRVAWRRVALGLGAACVTLALAAGVPLAHQLAGPQVPSALREVDNATGGDLLAVVTPTANEAVAPPGSAALASRFTAATTGQDGYVGLPLLALAALAAWTLRRRPHVRLAALLAAAYAVLSLGPSLEVAGRALPVPLPWAAVGRIPLVDNIVPLRLMGPADLCLAALAAWGLAAARDMDRRRRIAIRVLAVLAVVSWMPSLPRPARALPEPAALPASVARSIPSGAVVLFAPLPSEAQADAMWYQAASFFRFRLLAGYAYASHAPIPLEAVLRSAPDAAIDAAARGLQDGPVAAGDAVRLRALGVTTLVVPPGPSSVAYSRLIGAVCGRPPAMLQGFAVWATGCGPPAGGGLSPTAEVPTRAPR